MSAITPHLEEQEDPSWTKEQREAFRRERAARGTRGLGQSPVAHFFESDRLTADVMNQSTAELVNLSWVRQVVEQALAQRRFYVKAGDKNDMNPRSVFIILDGPVGPNPLWNPPPQADKVSQFELLSWTSKMGAPSFSIPAGAMELGGSCPGAAGGQSIVPVQALHAGAKRVTRVIDKPVQLDRSICQYCYATGGQYMTAQVQFAQVLRYVWSRMAIEDGSFVKTMIYAVENADYKLEGGKFNKLNYPKERHPGRYFRLHDSGDFYSPKYLAAWKQVCKHFEGQITFWAPTRIWATDWGIEAVNRINNPKGNFVIRPSAYHVNQVAPRDLGPGWAKGTTVYSPERQPQGPLVEHAGRPYDWECQAYAAKNEAHTCRHAQNPGGGMGCRACWRHGDDLEIDYTLH